MSGNERKQEFPHGDGETQNSGRPAVDSPEPVNQPNETDREAEKDGTPPNPTEGQTDGT